MLVPNVDDRTFHDNELLIGDTNRTPTTSFDFLSACTGTCFF